MSAKIIVTGIVLIAILGLGIWILIEPQTEPAVVEMPATETVPTTEIPPSVPEPPSTPAQENEPSVIDESAPIDKDLAEIDAQLKGLTDDTAAADQALNDTSENTETK